MNPPKIPKLKSRHIPVHSNTYVISSAIHWWKNSSPFIYPNVLINLLSCTKEQINKIKEDSAEELFLLTDSGGFQVISGQCTLDWKSSLEKQIELGASKIFAFDRPPVKQKFKGSLNQFIAMSNSETLNCIKENIDIAIKQSNYLKENYPDEYKKYCYVIHGNNLEQVQYNMQVFKEKNINLNELSPGGVVFAVKGNDNLMLAIIARYAYENFIKKGIYVHFLGLGSFNRMIILIRNKISTFDSSTVLQGSRINDFVNPINTTKSIQIGTKDFLFSKQFCTCPVCRNINYNELIKENDSMVGRHFIAHNLWHLLKTNVFLDGIPLEKYTEIILSSFKVSDDVKRCLEFCDYADKYNFDIAYNKYKYYLKKDESKQGALF